MFSAFECSQCGSTDFLEVSGKQVRCTHCGSLFEIITDEPQVVIQKGAKVVFGKSANVEIRGDMQINTGADVEIQGRVTVVKGKKKHVFKLKRVDG